MNPSLVRIAGLAAALACAAPPADAGEERDGAPGGPEGSLPKIGLVLAGGGARGMAHVGVIRLLEELNIEVDYVAGTSMGAIVGGLYAAGYNSDEMTAWLEQVDWERMLSDSLARRERGFRAKEEELETPRWIEFGVDRSGLRLPNAIVSGQNLLVALRELTGFIPTGGSFDEMPVPFRAVATDLESGDMVVLDRGNLADAMRASMAVPGVFAPHTVDGRVLIDGFASRNLPVSVARDMGADVIIAVDVRPDLLEAERLNTPVAMAQQLFAILSQRDTLAQIQTLAGRDVLLRLRLPGFGNASFSQAKKIVSNGYEEAQDARQALKSLAMPETAYIAREQQRRRLRRDPPIVTAIEVEERPGLNAKAVRSRISVSTGVPLDLDALSESLGKVHDLGFFSRVDYRIEDRPEGKVLVVTTEPKPWGPNFAVFGINLGSDLDGRSELNLKASLRFTQLNRSGGELALKASLGTVDRLDAELFQPVGVSGTFFVAPQAEIRREPEGFLLNLSEVLPGLRPLPLDFQRETLFGGAAAGARLGTLGELRVGMERGAVRYSGIRAASIVFVGPDGEPEVFDTATLLEEYTTNRVFGSLTLDRLDDPFFPRSGYFLHASISRESGRFGNTVASLRATAPVPIGKLVFQPRILADYTLDSGAESVRLPFRVGGLFNLSGLPTDEVFGANAFVGTLIARRKLAGRAGKLGIHVGGSIEVGNAWEDSGEKLPDDWIVAGSVFVASDTPLGPLHLAVGMAEGGSPTIYFYLGRIVP